MKNLLVGDNIKIGAVKESDFERLQEWFNDVSFMRHYDMVAAVPKGSRGIKELLDYYIDSADAYIFAIRARETDEIIGVCGFDEIVWNNGVATVFIGIGCSSLRGKGIGKEALGLLIEYAFHEMNFHRLQLDVISYNERAIRLYEGAGFVREGTYREFIFRDGSRHDMYLYGLLKDDWYKER